MRCEGMDEFVGARPPAVEIWDARFPIAEISEEKEPRIQTPGPSVIRWTSDRWQTMNDIETCSVLGGQAARLGVDELAVGSTVEFALQTEGEWEGRNHKVTNVASAV